VSIQRVHRRGLITLLPWLLAAVGLLTYANSLGGPFIYDDAVAVVENTSIRHLWPPRDVISPPARTPVAGRPVVNLTLALNFCAGGLDVRGYHAVNIVLHVMCGLFIYGIVRRTLAGERLGDRFGAAAPGLAGACALLWLVHPLQTECVNYITQRTESIMALFYLLTLYCAIRAPGSPRTLWWNAASVVCCALGMASKEAMVTAPLMVVLYDWAYRSGPYADVLRRRRGLYAGLAATWVVLVVLMAGGPRAATVGFGHGVGGVEYALNQCVAIAGYLKLVVWPDPLVLDYGFPGHPSVGEVLPYALLLAALLAAAVTLLTRRPVLGYPAVWLLVTLAPTSSVVPIATEVAAERRMYLPLAGLIVLVVIAAWLVAARCLGRPARIAAGLVLILVTASLVAVTWRRNAVYRDPVAVWEATVAAVPGNHRARTNLGTALVTAGRVEDAIGQFEASLRLEPDAARTAYNLANALAATGRVREAAAAAQQALSLAEAAGDDELAAEIRARLALFENGE
jgi:hypothetical protein